MSLKTDLKIAQKLIIEQVDRFNKDKTIWNFHPVIGTAFNTGNRIGYSHFDNACCKRFGVSKETVIKWFDVSAKISPILQEKVVKWCVEYVDDLAGL